MLPSGPTNGNRTAIRVSRPPPPVPKPPTGRLRASARQRLQAKPTSSRGRGARAPPSARLDAARTASPANVASSVQRNCRCVFRKLRSDREGCAARFKVCLLRSKGQPGTGKSPTNDRGYVLPTHRDRSPTHLSVLLARRCQALPTPLLRSTGHPTHAFSQRQAFGGEYPKPMLCELPVAQWIPRLWLYNHRHPAVGASPRSWMQTRKFSWRRSSPVDLPVRRPPPCTVGFLATLGAMLSTSAVDGFFENVHAEYATQAIVAPGRFRSRH